MLEELIEVLSHLVKKHRIIVDWLHSVYIVKVNWWSWLLYILSIIVVRIIVVVCLIKLVPLPLLRLLVILVLILRVGVLIIVL